MKTTVETPSLKKALARIAQVPGAKSNVFESNLVKISAAEFGGLTLTRFTTESIVVTQCEADVQESGEIIFDLSRLAQFAPKVSHKSVDINSTTLTAGRQTLKLGVIESAILPPELEDGVKMLSIPAGEFARWIKVCGPAMADESLNRVNLCGMILQSVSGKLWIFGTDGRRMHAIQTERDTEEINLIIPRESIQCVEKILALEAPESVIQFGIGERQIVLKTDSTELRSPLIETKPPAKLGQLLACSNPGGEFEVGVDELASALKAASPFGFDEQRFIDLHLAAASIELSANSQKGAEYHQEIELKGRPMLASGLSGFRCGASYLSAALDCIGEIEDVKLRFSGSGQGCYMSNADVSIVVMGVHADHVKK